MKKLLPILIIIFAGTFTSYAQFDNLRQNLIGQEKGLPNTNITCILQDNKGFMWFGSGTGLFRYDGINFLSYYYDAHDSTSISGNYIINMLEDKDGDLWIITSDGLNKFDRKKEIFKKHPHEHLIESNYNTWLIHMIFDNQGDILVANRRGDVLIFDIKTETFSTVELGLGPDINIGAIFIDSKGNLWVGADHKGLHVFEIKGNAIVHLYQYNTKNKNGLSDDLFETIYEDRSGKIWVGTQNGLDCIIPFQDSIENGKIEHYYHEPDNLNSLSHNDVIAIKEDKNGILWISCANGLNTFDPTTGQFRLIEPNINVISTFEIYLTFKVLWVDNTGSIWYGYKGGGIIQLSFHQNKFNFIHQDSLLNQSADFNEVSYILEDTSGLLWAGTWFQGLNKGIPRKNGNGYIWHNYVHNPTDPKSISGNRIRQIYRDSRNNLWIADYEGGLNKYIDLENGQAEFKHFKPDSVEGFRDWFEFICEDVNNNMWVGGRKLYLFDRDENKFYPFIPDTINSNDIFIGAISSISTDLSGNIWLGTWINGLFKASPPFKREGSSIKGKIISYKSDKDLPNNLGAWEINTTLVPKHQKDVLLWIGTRGGGLYSLKNETDKNGIYKEFFTNYTEEDGLPDIEILGIEEDDKGDLWISTALGLSRYNPDSNVFANYREGDGLPDNILDWLAHSKGPDGKLYFGNRGILSFYPDSIYKDDFIPPVYITRILLFNQPLKVGDDSPLKSSLSNTREIIFNHQQNAITIEFAALNYINSEENRYKYKLEGIEKDWVDAGTRHSASYIGLTSGKYTFKVIGSNNKGLWNKQAATLRIIIKPPWWKTLPAIFTYIILLVLSFIFSVKFRERKLLNEKKKLEQKVTERTKDLHEVNVQLKEHHEELEQQKEELQQTLDFLKETQTQLVQSEKMASVGQLTAGIAHEINNPVNYISGGIESLEVNLKEIREILDLYHAITPENVKEKLIQINELKERLDYKELLKEIADLTKSIKAGSVRTTEIVKGLRTFSRLDENEIKPADIHDGLDLTLVMLHNKYKHHVEIRKEYGELPMIDCYPGKLNQVFMNILSNGIEAIAEKGTITIKTREDKPNNEVFISIKDDGEGMSESTKSNLFNPFFTTKDVGKGTGLGLSISHGIIEQHKGKIEVNSKPGEGAEFIISLPVKQR